MSRINIPNKTFKIFYGEAVYHLYFWAFSYLAYLALVLMVIEDKSLIYSLIYSLCQIVLCSIPVYINLHLLNKFLSYKRYLLYVFCLVAIILVSAILIRYFFIKIFGDPFTLFDYIFEISWFVAITTGLKYTKNSFGQKLELQELKAKQLQTELSLLKAQINPHFLFNTLNNLFGLVQKNDKKAADGIVQLSHLMRYMIYESAVDRIDLNKELEQLQRFIQLQKLRFSKDDDITIDLQIEGNTEEIQIAPMLLIPFVENAFKHGISLKKQSFLFITLKINKPKLEFSVRNSIHENNNQKEQSDTGLGLNNVKRRLQLLYPDAHELKIREDGKTFEVQLFLKD